MRFSIKSPNAIFWKTAWTEKEIKTGLEGGRITGDWWVCPLGESAQAVTVSEFIDNPSILKGASDVQSAHVPYSAANPNARSSVAAMGWRVFFGALLAHLSMTLFVGEYAANFSRSMGATSVANTLLEGIDALIIAGAITSLLGHAYTKITLAERGSADESATASESKPDDH